MNHFEAIRILALRSVTNPTPEYLIRKIIRWYARSFHMDPRVVENDIPLDDVLLAYYEEKYADMTEEQLAEERAELLMTSEQRYQRMMEKDAEEAEAIEFARIVEAEEAEKARKRAEKAKAVPPPPPGQIAEVPPAPGPVVPQDEMPLPKELPPAISMTFMNPDDFARELEEGSLPEPDEP